MEFGGGKRKVRRDTGGDTGSKKTIRNQAGVQIIRSGLAKQ